MKLKIPKIFEETDDFIEYEIPEGLEDEYDLKGCEKSGSGEGLDEESGTKEYFSYYKKIGE